jgi:hypothetical protein
LPVRLRAASSSTATARSPEASPERNGPAFVGRRGVPASDQPSSIPDASLRSQWRLVDPSLSGSVAVGVVE